MRWNEGVMVKSVTITKKEQRAIAELKALAKRWPKTISLFGWSGTLHVFKRNTDGRQMDITIIPIYCDGGDPSEVEVEHSPEITWE